jgi:hypothetical protein
MNPCPFLLFKLALALSFSLNEPSSVPFLLKRNFALSFSLNAPSPFLALNMNPRPFLFLK